jgi:hypothetical protein
MSSVNGYELKASKPDKDGFYTVCVGCLGVPTRGKVIYDPSGMLKALSDPQSRFNTCLREGYLAGEWGHPDCESREDIKRLLKIDESKVSHYFGRIWFGKEFTLPGKGIATPIMAKVKPYGPYGKYLEESLQDPCHNTSFSIRSLCLPMRGEDPRYEYRMPQIVVTFDAVHAPGYEITAKRYVASQEDFREIDVPHDELLKVAGTPGMESLAITDAEIHRLIGSNNISYEGTTIATAVGGRTSLLDKSGSLFNSASLAYRRR